MPLNEPQSMSYSQASKPPKAKAAPKPSRRKRTGTRTKLLELAESAVLEKGFSGTSIEELIVGAGITKSGFFYHFPDKNALAKALLEQYLENDIALVSETFARARELDDDPLHAFLVGLKMLTEIFDDLPNGHPGCVVAATVYQEQLFNQEIRNLCYEGMLSLRSKVLESLNEVAERYPPKIPVSMDDLADMLSALVDGGIILSRALRDPKITSRQMLMYRDFIRMIFQP